MLNRYGGKMWGGEDVGSHTWNGFVRCGNKFQCWIKSPISLIKHIRKRFSPHTNLWLSVETSDAISSTQIHRCQPNECYFMCFFFFSLILCVYCKFAQCIPIKMHNNNQLNVGCWTKDYHKLRNNSSSLEIIFGCWLGWGGEGERSGRSPNNRSSRNINYGIEIIKLQQPALIIICAQVFKCRCMWFRSDRHSNHNYAFLSNPITSIRTIEWCQTTNWNLIIAVQYKKYWDFRTSLKTKSK